MSANPFANHKIVNSQHFTIRHDARFTKTYPSTHEFRELLAKAAWYEDLWRGPDHYWAVATYQRSRVEMCIHLAPGVVTIKTVYQSDERRAKRLTHVTPTTARRAVDDTAALHLRVPTPARTTQFCELCGRAAACAPTRIERATLHACAACQKHGIPLGQLKITIRLEA